MKKAFLLLYIILFSPLLTGCGSIYSNFREVEHLLVIQTMGIDQGQGGIELSLASAADKGSGPIRLSGQGESITTAIDRVRRRSYEDELFCSHINHIVLGEECARQGVEDIIAYICRSPDIRIDVPLYVVQGGKAADLVMESGSDTIGASEILNGVQVSLDGRDDFRSFTAAEVARSLARHGSALICALEYTDAAKDSEEESKTATVSGYAVIRNGALCGFLDRDQAIAAGLLLNDPGISDITVRGADRKSVTIEIDRGSSTVQPLRDDAGKLIGLEIYVQVGASVAEAEGDPAGTDYLTAQLEAAVSRQIGMLLRSAKELGADFLGLGSRIERLMPDEFRESGSFAEVLPELELRVHVLGDLEHTNDIKDA